MKCLSSTSAGSLRRGQLSPTGNSALYLSDNDKVQCWNVVENSLHSSASFPDPVYATALYPGWEDDHTDSWLYLVSYRDHPIQLREVLTGECRASYPLLDHRELLTAPYSIIINKDASWVICGSESRVSTFPLNRPGIITQSFKTNSSQSATPYAQKGKISSLALAPEEDVLAVGDFCGNIGLYDQKQGGVITVLGLKECNGVTDLKWSVDGNLLAVGCRNPQTIETFDVRNTHSHLYSICRDPSKLKNHQRLFFDRKGNSLVSGTMDGTVTFLDFRDGGINASFEVGSQPVSSVSMHPTENIMLTTIQWDRSSKEDFDLDTETLKVWQHDKRHDITQL